MEKMTHKEKMLKEFKTVDSFSTQDVIELLNISNGYARNLCARAVNSGDLERIDLGLFKVVERTNEYTTSERIADILYEQMEILAMKNYDPDITGSELRKNITALIELIKTGKV